MRIDGAGLAGVKDKVPRATVEAAETARTFLPAWLHERDLKWFRRVVSWQWPLGERILPRLTSAANHSKIWMGIALVIWLFGGRFGRRAALRGLFSIAVSSFIANLPVKLLSRRDRPSIEQVPLVRRVVRLPKSTSFPSGHTASAFAFAFGVTQEKPLLGLAVFPLAAAVGYSRIYTGVHYPIDVIAGAALGAAVAVGSRNLWPVAPEGEPTVRPQRVDFAHRAELDGEGLAIVVNPSSGSALQRTVTDTIRKALPQADVVELGDEDLKVALEKAAQDARALGIAGGDGTVNVAAEIALKYELPLLVIPTGTLNHFARDLGLEKVDDALEAFKAQSVASVDVATIDDHLFLNTASFGNYVDLVDARERLEETIGKWPAAVVGLVKVLRNSNPVLVKIDGVARKIWMIFVGNCAYQPPGFVPGWRARMDDRTLDVRVVTAHSAFSRTRFVASVLTGTIARSRVYQTMPDTNSLKVESLEGPLRLARDGETFDGSESFVVRKLAERLTVFVPPEN